MMTNEVSTSDQGQLNFGIYHLDILCCFQERSVINHREVLKFSGSSKMALRLCRVFAVGSKISTPVLRGSLVRASSHGDAALPQEPHKDKLGK